MRRIEHPRFLLASALALLGCVAAGRAEATDIAGPVPPPLECRGNLTNPQLLSSSIEINRTFPLGPIAGVPVQSHGAARVQCMGGSIGMPLEVALRVPGINPRPNPFGPGVLFDTHIPGLGVVVETTAPTLISSGFQVVITTTRNVLQPQLLPSIAMRVYPVKTGEINLMQDYELHGIPILHMDWRAPGVQDAWVEASTWYLSNMAVGEKNVRTETCYLGNDAHTPLVRTENMGPVAGGDFSGIGTEAPSRHIVGTIVLRCRNYAGGSLHAESPSRHPTMPGVLGNAQVGAGASRGVGIRLRDDVGGVPWDFLAPWPLRGFGELTAIHQFDYHARYVQTEDVVAPGTFSAAITFTVSYD